jgi:hypothetical protein
MKKLLIPLFSIFLCSPSVFADDIDLYELSTKYPHCQSSNYRDGCFDDYLFETDETSRAAGYFRGNLLWEGLMWQNDVLSFEFHEGKLKAVMSCDAIQDDWYQCSDGQKFKPLEDGYFDVNNSKQGRFIFIFADGAVFEGNLIDDRTNGYGKFTWTDGSVYEGNWENGNFGGYGKFAWSNGDVYEGNWENDIQHGYGKFTWADGDVYEGNWENGEMTD